MRLSFLTKEICQVIVFDFCLVISIRFVLESKACAQQRTLSLFDSCRKSCITCTCICEAFQNLNDVKSTTVKPKDNIFDIIGSLVLRSFRLIELLQNSCEIIVLKYELDT